MVARGHFLELGAFQAVVGGVIYLQAFHAQACQIGDELLRDLIPQLVLERMGQGHKGMAVQEGFHDRLGRQKFLGRAVCASVLQIFLKNMVQIRPQTLCQKGSCHMGPGDDRIRVPGA